MHFVQVEIYMKNAVLFDVIKTYIILQLLKQIFSIRLCTNVTSFWLYDSVDLKKNKYRQNIILCFDIFLECRKLSLPSNAIYISPCLFKYDVMCCAQSFSHATLCDPMDCSLPGSSVRGNSSGKNTGVGCQALIKGIFPTQELIPGLPYRRQILYFLNHQGSP